MQYLENTAEGSRDMGLDDLLSHSLQLSHRLNELLQNLTPDIRQRRGMRESVNEKEKERLTNSTLGRHDVEV